MVKDSKKAPAAEKPLRRAQKAFVALGRPAGDPDDIRSERLVLRVHPDLLDTLNESARASGITRSLYVEKILLTYLNRIEGARLDAIGRRVEGFEPGEADRRPRPDEVDDSWTEQRTSLAKLRHGGNPPIRKR